MASLKKATFGAGCFWGVEETFNALPGVLETTVGYEGGATPNPTYRDVCSSATGHAEVVEVAYDPDRVPYDKLLEVFFELHDPTQLNRQGPDVGTQYRSVVFYHDEAQQNAARAAVLALGNSGRFARPVVTQVVPAQTFFRAEEYHQKYFAKVGAH